MYPHAAGADTRKVHPARVCRRAALVALASLPVLGAGAAAAAPPDDPLFGQQWPLARNDVLRVAEAWRQSTGAGVTVAVLDTGANLQHPDLAGALWTNPGEIPGNGIDDDRDGFVDDVNGVDIVNADGDPSDDEGHGTHVAGVIAARANNRIGGAGLAPEAKVMVVKVLNSHRSGSAGDLAAGITFALAHGARIINTSVNGDGVSRALQSAIARATSAGALVVSSAGNDGRDIDLTPSYPASYPDPSVVTAAADGPDGHLSSFSNYGLTAVDVAAPGEDVLSTAMDGGYELRSGTSMAAPYVTATLALMSAAAPGLSGPALKEALLGSTRPSGLLNGLLGGGGLDVAAAVRAVVGDAGWRGSSLPLTLRALRAAKRGRSAAVLRWVVAGETAPLARVRISLDGELLRELPAGAPARLPVSALPGRHRWSAVAVDASGATLARTAGVFRLPRARR